MKENLVIDFRDSFSIPRGYLKIAGHGPIKGVRNYGGVNGNSNDGLTPAINGLKNQSNFSSRNTSLGALSQISEIECEDIGATSPDDGRVGTSNSGDTRYYGPGFSFASWNDTSHVSENLTGFRRDHTSNGNLYSDSQVCYIGSSNIYIWSSNFVCLVFLFLIYTSRYVQNIEHGSRVNVLSHHLSLPKSTSHVAGVEKFFQYPDSVPCKIRAKRGCATHPRSIAERVSFFFSLLKCMLNMGVLVCIKQIEVIISPLLDMREIN